MNDFIKERNEALLSLDKEKIIAYSKKHNIDLPKDEKVFWAGVHKAICNLYLYSTNDEISLEQYERSYTWLSENGFSPSIFGGDKK